jgi:hypothetical protein
METRWNDIDRGNLKIIEKNLSQCYFVPPLKRLLDDMTAETETGHPGLNL